MSAATNTRPGAYELPGYVALLIWRAAQTKKVAEPKAVKK